MSRARLFLGTRPFVLLSVCAAAAGCSTWPASFKRPISQAPELRFVTRADLGLSAAPLPLDIVYALQPGLRLEPAALRWAGAGRDPGREASRDADLPGLFRAVTRNVLSETFRSAVEVAPDAYGRIEELRRAQPPSDKKREPLPPLCAKALLLIDFRPPLAARPDLAPQLSVRVFDISFARYDEVTLWNPRLLIFEDYAEVPEPEGPARLAGALVPAWKETFERMLSSDRFRRYLALGDEPLSLSHPDGERLLGIISPERAPRSPDPRTHEWIEREILFPEEAKPPLSRAVPAPPPVFSGDAAAEPAEDAAAGAPGPAGEGR